MSIWTTVWCKQKLTRNKKLASLTFALCWTETHKYYKFDRHRPEAVFTPGPQSEQLCNVSKTLPSWHKKKKCSLLSLNVVFFFSVQNSSFCSLRRHCLKKNKKKKTAQCSDRGHRPVTVKHAVPPSGKSVHTLLSAATTLDKWQQSAASSLSEEHARNLPPSAGNVQVQLHSSSPIPWCWGRCSLQALKRGRGHLSGCRAPLGGCCYLWSPLSLERMAQSLAREQKHWEYCPEAHLPLRSFGLAPWKPHCVLKVTTKRQNEDSSLYKIRYMKNKTRTYQGQRRGGCLGWWRPHTEEGGHQGAGCQDICRLHTAEEALGNEKRLPLHHQRDAGEWGQCQRHPGHSQSLELVFQG